MNQLRKKVVLATRNNGKVKEFADRFGAIGWDVVALPDDAPNVVEDGTTFEQNAIKKAFSAARFCGLPALSDDSGLEVDALQGRPGVYSARYAGEHATDEENNQKLLQELTGVPSKQRTARFVCALAFIDIDSEGNCKEPIVVRGTCDGLILDSPRGSGGFGYDPLMYLPDFQKTVAELTPDEKHEVSHRGHAVRTMIDTVHSIYNRSGGDPI
jgi:XTP/dITP diphosphohydrolase